MIWFFWDRGESKPHKGNETAAYWNTLQRTLGLYHKLLSCVGKLGEVNQLKASKNFGVLCLPSAFRGLRTELGLSLSVDICERKQMWPMKRKGSLAALSSALPS